MFCHRFRDIARQFFVENAHLLTSLLFNPEFKNVSLALNLRNFACLGLCHIEPYTIIRVKVFPKELPTPGT